MIDTEIYKKKFEDCCSEAGFKKLSEPVEDAEPFYCATTPENDDNFDRHYWEVMMAAILRAVAQDDNSEYYQLDVYYREDTLIITISRGDLPIKGI